MRSATRVPPKPKWCDVDYGGGVAVDKKGKAGFVCAGDTTLESGPPLPYEHSISPGASTAKVSRPGCAASTSATATAST